MRRIIPILVACAVALSVASPVAGGNGYISPQRRNVPWQLLAAPATAAGTVRVYYAGPEGGVRQALYLAGFDIVNDAAQADVLVLNGIIPDPAAMAVHVRAGSGLVLIFGPGLTEEALQTMLGVPLRLEKSDEPLSLAGAPGVSDKALTEIVWTSAPQVRERYVPVGGGVGPYAPLVLGFEDRSPILASGAVGAGPVFFFTPFLDEANPQFQGWAYFNYLVYHLVVRAAGDNPLSFADYPASPVPHASDRAVLFGLSGLMLITAAGVFVAVRRYSLAHPQELDTLVANRAYYAAREIGTDWEEVGFHRPLGGFLLSLMLGLVLFIPLIIYQNLVLPVYILPSAQALGIWGRVTQFFNMAWLLFDMGTGVAFVKFMSEYRVDDPRKGVQYGQLFVWWQILSGAVQVALVIGLSSTVVAHSTYALYAWSVIVHTLIQIPGFYQVMRNTLTGLQRFDNALIFAYFVGLVSKGVVAYVINHRTCFPQRFYVWQSLVAPLLAGAAHYAVLRWVGGLIWHGDQITSVAVFFIGILPSFPLFAFFYALFGGWDDDTLDEFKRAASLTGPARPLAWMYWAASAWGGRISPLHGRFPMDIRPAALREANALTLDRVAL